MTHPLNSNNIKIIRAKKADPAIQSSKSTQAEIFFPGGLNDFAIGFILLDANGNILRLNSPASNMLQKMWGVNLKEQDNLQNSLNKADKKLFAAHFKKVLKGKNTRQECSFEVINQRCTIIFNLHPITDNAGSISFIFLSIEDITDRINSNKINLLLSQAVEQSPASIIITDTNGNISYVNKKFREVTGYDTAEVIGRNPKILKSGHTSDHEYSALWSNLKAGIEWRGEFHNKKKNGELFWESALISPVLDEKGKIMNYLAIKEDISQRKTAESAAAMNQKLFQSLVENIPGVYWITDIEKNKTIYLSPSFEAITGRNAEDIYNNQSVFFDMVHPDDRARIVEHYHNRNATIEYTYRIVKPDGETRWIAAKSTISSENGNKMEYGYAEDITIRKQIELEIKDTQDRYELVNKATDDIIWEWDMETNSVIRSNSSSIFFGYEITNSGQDLDWWMEQVHIDDQQKIRDAIKNCVENGKDTWQEEYRFRATDGFYRIVQEKAYVLYNEKKLPYRMIGVMSDITERRKLEKELIDLQVQKQKYITETTIRVQEKERNELGKELHDNINQILATVKMYLGLTQQEDFDTKELIDKSLEYTILAMEEIRKLAHSLVDPTLGQITLPEAILKLTDRMNVKGSLQFHFCNDLLPAFPLSKKVELMIYRIIQEQVNNILKYAAASEVKIHLYEKENLVSLVISDNGCGFDPQSISGGIGLTNIKNRVEHYSGNMNIISAPGKGCKLEISFPADAVDIDG